MIRFLINNIPIETLARLIDCVSTIIDYIQVAYPDDAYIVNMFQSALDYLIKYQTNGKR